MFGGEQGESDGEIGGKMVCVIGGGEAGPTSSKRSAIRNDECDC